jgi:UDP-galactopyranose mutase
MNDNSQIAFATGPKLPPVICFSHLRWSFVYQRPQHLMSRLALQRRVLFVEEPVFDGMTSHMECRQESTNLSILTPHVDVRLAGQPGLVTEALDFLLGQLVADERLGLPILWYYTPMALGFSSSLPKRMVVYDCMDELSAFAGAPIDLVARERQLIKRAQLVLTGGRSLFEAKRHLHHNVHFFPSSVDVDHFARALDAAPDPEDQLPIAHPRIGFAGVIDERMDLPLLARVAQLRPQLHFVMLGPLAKIDPGSLPQAPNIHYLGLKAYADLPRYMGGWDAAILPFARNQATRFISPTKTPEYLAAGLPVVSTSIRDVVRPYGQMGLVRIADEPRAFAAALSLALGTDLRSHRASANAFLANMSWDQTVLRIQALLHDEGRNSARRSQRIGRANIG